MSDLRDQQQQLLNYIVGSEPREPDFVLDDQRLGRSKRLSIYASAYRLRLYGVLQNDHEILQRYIAEEKFARVCEDFIAQTYSRDPSLRNFGQQFPRFLTDHPLVIDEPYIAEIAAFERALLDAFDAADARAMSLQDLQQIEADRWPGLQLGFQASATLFNTAWNSVELWQHVKSDKSPPRAQAHDQDLKWLIWRGQTRLSEFRHCPLPEARAFAAFEAGDQLAEVCALLTEHLAADDISRFIFETIARWLNDGVVASIIAE